MAGGAMGDVVHHSVFHEQVGGRAVHEGGAGPGDLVALLAREEDAVA